MNNKIFSLLQCIFLFSLISCSKDEQKNSYIFKTIDLVTNKPIEKVNIKLAIEIGFSKLLDSKKVSTNKDGHAEIILDANQDTIDAFYKKLPSAQRYLNNAITVEKEGYGISQLKQDTSIAYTFRPILAENKTIITYMYQLIPFTIDFKNSKNSLSNKFVNVIINCYPKHPLLDSKVPEYQGEFLLDTDPKDFLYQSNLAAIDYDIEVIIFDEVDKKEVFKEKFPLSIDKNNTQNNTIQINY